MTAEFEWAIQPKRQRSLDADNEAPSVLSMLAERLSPAMRLSADRRRSPKRCVNPGCHLEARAKDRCWGCYRHLQRHGVDRDALKAERRRIRHNERNLERELEAKVIRQLVRSARAQIGESS